MKKEQGSYSNPRGTSIGGSAEAEAECSFDDILFGELKLNQPAAGCGPRVNVDTVLLAHYARFPARARVLEMGCAHGAISLILARRRANGRPRPPKIDAFDLNPGLVEMAGDNARLNGLGEFVDFFVSDLREHRKNFRSESYDVVIMNPPYDEAGRSRPNENAAMAAAMHGECCTLLEVVSAGKYLLKNGGRLFLVVRAKRLGELFAIQSVLNVKPKRVRMVHPKPGREASVALVESVRASGDGIKVEPPLFICGEDGAYTPELLSAYRIGGK